MKKFLLLLALLALAIVPAAAQEELMAVDGGCEYGGAVQKIEAIDTLTVKITLCAPDPAFPSKAAFSAFAIHSATYLEETGGAPVEAPVGTGPYRVERWDRGSEIVFTANENYWGEAAKEPTLIFRWNSESAARVTELQAGTADGIDNPGPADFAVIEADPNLALYPREGTNVFYIGFNNTIPPFDNLNVRKAIAMAILDLALSIPGNEGPAADEEFVLQHCDALESSGFVEHLKLPHYVTFQSQLDRLRYSRLAKLATGESRQRA